MQPLEQYHTATWSFRCFGTVLLFPVHSDHYFTLPTRYTRPHVATSDTRVRTLNVAHGGILSSAIQYNSTVMHACMRLWKAIVKLCRLLTY